MSEARTKGRGLSARQSASGASWTILSRLVAMAGQLGFFLLVARALGPSVIGIFAMASAIALGLGLLSSAGFRAYTSSHVDDVPRLAIGYGMATLAGPAAMCLGLCMAGVMMLLSYGDTLFAPLLAALSIGLVFPPLTDALVGELIGRGRLGTVARLTIAADLLAILGATFAYSNGLGIWTLVIQRTLMQAFSLAFAYSITQPGTLNLNPATPLSRELGHHLVTFIIATALGWIKENGPLLLLGTLSGSTAAGLFRVASRFSGAVRELAAESAGRLAWARFAGDRATDATGFSVVTLTITTPLFLGLALVAEPLTLAVLGAEWQPAAPVLVMLALSRWAEVQMPALIPTLTAQRRFRAILGLSLAATAVTLASVALTLPAGILMVAVGLLLAELLNLGLRLWLSWRSGHLVVARAASEAWRPLLAAIAMAGALVWLKESWLTALGPWQQLLALVGLGVGAWSLAMLSLHPVQVSRLATGLITKRHELRADTPLAPMGKKSLSSKEN